MMLTTAGGGTYNENAHAAAAKEFPRNVISV